jgi:rhamnulokinase
MKGFVALDLGASNGRCVLGQFDGERLSLKVLQRFENCPIELMEHLHWDILGLYSNIRQSLQALGSAGYRKDVASLGVDAWGCDFALLDSQGKLAGNPFCYRDPQTQGMLAEALRRVPREEIFQRTGLQFMELNSLYQLMAMQVRGDPLYQAAATFLHIPDLMHYWLTGVKASEYTSASTSQMLDATRQDWALNLLAKLGLRNDIFPPILQPGSRLGKLRTALTNLNGLNDLEVIATATHDTAAAIVAAPAQEHPFAYLSSGTWGLLGQEIDAPLLTPKCLQLNITNEGGAFGKIALLRNIANLWLLQECRRAWTLEGASLTWKQLGELAQSAPAFSAFIDPDDPAFLLPGDMPRRIQTRCQASGQPIPQSKGEIVRVVLESLAYKYRYTLGRVEEVSGQKAQVLHIIGGGSRNRLLNQLSANATGLEVRAGPAEATAIGNVLVQMAALGYLGDLEEGRSLVQRSFPCKIYAPQEAYAWESNYPLFLKVNCLDRETAN